MQSSYSALPLKDENEPDSSIRNSQGYVGACASTMSDSSFDTVGRGYRGAKSVVLN